MEHPIAGAGRRRAGRAAGRGRQTRWRSATCWPSSSHANQPSLRERAAAPDRSCRREPQQDRSRLTRRRLLDATVSLAVPRSAGRPPRSSIVAARAGVSRGAAQHHFPTREVAVRGGDRPHQRAAAGRTRPRRLRAAAGRLRRAPRRCWACWSRSTPARCSGPPCRCGRQPRPRTGCAPRLVPLEAELGRRAHELAVATARCRRVGAGRARDGAGHPGPGPGPGPGRRAARRFAPAARG